MSNEFDLQVCSPEVANKPLLHGKTTRLRVLTYAGEGEIISTTVVKLNLNSFMEKLSAIDTDL